MSKQGEQSKTVQIALQHSTSAKASDQAELIQRAKGHWADFGETKDRSLFQQIIWAMEPQFSQILASHPAYELWQRANNVDIAFDILTQSRLAFIDISGRYHARLDHDHVTENDDTAALREATKEVYTYSCAALSLVQAYRHLTSGNDEAKRRYDDFKNQIIGDSPIITFISDLRVSNNHLRILVAAPHFTIEHDFEHGTRTVKSGFKFDRDAILNGSRWSEVSKSLARSSDLNAIGLINDHYKLATQFNHAVLVRTGIHADRSYRDILNIVHAREVAGIRHSLVFILQMAKGRNPYEYLQNWFTVPELKNIYAFPDHTMEQVEYIISLRDPFGICDEGMRRMLYEIFSVTEQQKPA